MRRMSPIKNPLRQNGAVLDVYKTRVRFPLSEWCVFFAFSGVARALTTAQGLCRPDKVAGTR